MKISYCLFQVCFSCINRYPGMAIFMSSAPIASHTGSLQRSNFMLSNYFWGADIPTLWSVFTSQVLVEGQRLLLRFISQLYQLVGWTEISLMSQMSREKYKKITQFMWKKSIDETSYLFSCCTCTLASCKKLYTNTFPLFSFVYIRFVLILLVPIDFCDSPIF